MTQDTNPSFNTFRQFISTMPRRCQDAITDFKQLANQSRQILLKNLAKMPILAATYRKPPNPQHPVASGWKRYTQERNMSVYRIKGLLAQLNTVGHSLHESYAFSQMAKYANTSLADINSVEHPEECALLANYIATYRAYKLAQEQQRHKLEQITADLEAWQAEEVQLWTMFVESSGFDIAYHNLCVIEAARENPEVAGWIKHLGGNNWQPSSYFNTEDVNICSEAFLKVFETMQHSSNPRVRAILSQARELRQKE